MKSLLLLLTALMLTGCTGFRGNWKKSLEAGSQGIEGPWAGTWKSESTGHTDKLRCIVTKTSGNNYSARFHAKYHRILSFSYTVSLRTTNQPGSDRFDFDGDANLGKLAGGKYTYKGHATPTNFYSTYDSKYDHGTFEMSRPKE